jgi:RIO kinase 1
MEQTEDELKEIVRNWLDAGVGLQDDSKSTAADGTTTANATSSAQDDAVFMSSYIPRNLGEVYDPERDIEAINKGQGEDLIYAGVTGLNTQSASTKGAAVIEKESNEATSEKSRRQSIKSVRFEDEDEQESEGETEDSDDEDAERKPRWFRHEDRDAKKVRRRSNEQGIILTRMSC